jgi:hypothetical protein
MKWIWVFALALCGCHVSSNVDFKGADFNEKPFKHHNSKAQLKESEVLGLHEKGEVTDEEIRRTLDETRSFRLKKGASVLLVQSGVSVPDRAMVDEMSKHFHVVPHTGIASEILPSDSNGATLSRSLRLAAAQANAEAIVVYWGNLEMKRDEMPTHIVSWVPVVDVVVPDEYQKLRMRLKVALIDVRSGRWSSFRAEPFEEKALSTRYSREHSDSGSIASLKKKTYQSAVEELMKCRRMTEHESGSTVSGGKNQQLPGNGSFHWTCPFC